LQRKYLLQVSLQRVLVTR